MMLVAKPAHKAVRSDDFMFVVIEASQEEENKVVCCS
jgi:hypothetical protein